MPILSLLHEVKSVESQRHRARKTWVHATAAASAKALSDKAIRGTELRKPLSIFARRAAPIEEERSAPFLFEDDYPVRDRPRVSARHAGFRVTGS